MDDNIEFRNILDATVYEKDMGHLKFVLKLAEIFINLTCSNEAVIER